MITFINSTGMASWHFDIKWPSISFLRGIDTTTVQSHIFKIIANQGLFKENSQVSCMWSFECNHEKSICFSNSFDGSKGLRHTNNARRSNNG